MGAIIRRRWTKAEDGVLRAQAPRVASFRPLCALLPGRTHASIKSRARELGLRTRRRWSRAEVAVLRDGWHEYAPRGLKARLPGRTWYAIRQKADEIGLPSGVPQGFESFNACCARTGFHHDALRRILDREGVRLRVCYPRGPGRRELVHRCVDPDEVDAALARWLAAETIQDGERRHGLRRGTLRDWFEASGELRLEWRHGRHWRIPAEVTDRVVAAHRAGLEAWRAARKRAA
jgi:hypothetical protein